jgi:uncharacterized membrane protein YccF (DUF307 family)
MRLILNILWFLFGGFISMLAWLLAGLVLACTVVGLPWAFAAFRIAGFSAAPFGRQVLPKTAAEGGGGPLDGVLNIVWFIFAGWWLALHHLVLAIALMVTIIGIPFGLQHLKLAVTSLAPVGTRVVDI